MIQYRKMKHADIPAGLALCRSAGWNQLAADWEIFLKESPDGCMVAVDETRKVVGTVTTINYEDRFSWIGMVLVDPLKKKQGVGTQLLHEALTILKNQKSIRLDATPAGREIYLRLNFTDEYPLKRMYTLSPVTPETLRAEVTQMNKHDLDPIFVIDEEVFGANRKNLLLHLWKNNRQLAHVLKIHDRVVAYCFGRNGYLFTHIGPVIGENVDHAKQLVAAALQNCKRNPVSLDVSHNNEWLDWLSSMGFKEQRSFMRMYRGSNDSPGKVEKQFAILGPEFG
jgi:GNAT superfamily N-acetyltransferase